MIHVFKKGGERGVPPNDYSIDCINEDESSKFLAGGWHLSLDEALLGDVEPEHEQVEQEPVADTNGDGKLSIDEALLGDVEPEHEQVEQEPVADTNGDGKLSLDEARAYLDSVGVEYEDGLHWKKVIALAEQHVDGE